MMNRWIWFVACAIAGLVLFICGWLVPTHLRAVDVSVIQKAGHEGPGLVEQALDLVNHQKLGTAQMLLQAAHTEGLRGQEQLVSAVGALADERPKLLVWGMPEPRLENFVATNTNARQEAAAVKTRLAAGAPNVVFQPVTEVVVKLENRDRILDFLSASQKPLVQDVLRTRSLTNTTVFSPSQSAAGQAFDAALSITALLIEGDYLNSDLRDTIGGLVTGALQGGKPQPLEDVMLELMSLGQRLNWGQLVDFVRKIKDLETLRLLCGLARKTNDQLPVLFSAVTVSQDPAGVAKYLMTFSQTGLADLGAALRYGSGGVNELLKRDQRLYSSSLRQQAARLDPLGAIFDFGLDYSSRNPQVAIAMKWFFYLAGGFFLALSMHFARPKFSGLEAPLQVGGFHVAREILFALGFLLVVLLLSEPFLAQENQRADMPLRLRLPMVGNAAPAGSIAAIKPNIMNNKSLLTLLLFFVLQALIYTSCVFKLAEIRRQRIGPRVKLKLLDNEEHLFDSGLYLGFAGTIISLILVSMGFIKPSLMAAYSSTSFGIVFVSIFKIFHLRPAKRKLLLEAENPAPAPVPQAAARPTFAAPL
jgi:hypothetical protein